MCRHHIRKGNHDVQLNETQGNCRSLESNTARLHVVTRILVVALGIRYYYAGVAGESCSQLLTTAALRCSSIQHGYDTLDRLSTMGKSNGDDSAL